MVCSTFGRSYYCRSVDISPGHRSVRQFDSFSSQGLILIGVIRISESRLMAPKSKFGVLQRQFSGRGILARLTFPESLVAGRLMASLLAL